MPDVKSKEQVYKAPRPKEAFDRFHRRVREHRPNWDYELVRTILTPYLLGFFRTRAFDTYNVPADGPCILAPNHFSFLDHFFLAVYLRRKVHFMAKSQLFKLPLWPFFNYGGVFPICRGHADQEAFDTAHAILARGDIVVMYLEGGRSRTGELGTPRPGVGRLAAAGGPGGGSPPSSLVRGVQAAEGRHVVAGHDERVGVLVDVELDLAQRAAEAVLVGHPVGQRGVGDRLPRVGGVGGQQDLPIGESKDDGAVSGRVAGREHDPHAAVAEQVERAAEAGERVGGVALEVEQPVVEGMVELALDVAVGHAAADGGLPLGGAEDERRAGELGD